MIYHERVINYSNCERKHFDEFQENLLARFDYATHRADFIKKGIEYDRRQTYVCTYICCRDQTEQPSRPVADKFRIRRENRRQIRDAKQTVCLLRQHGKDNLSHSWSTPKTVSDCAFHHVSTGKLKETHLRRSRNGERHSKP